MAALFVIRLSGTLAIEIFQIPFLELEASVGGDTTRHSLVGFVAWAKEKIELVVAPDRIEVTYVNTCGAVKRSKRWVNVGDRNYTDVTSHAVTEKLGVHIDGDSVSWPAESEQVDQLTVRLQCQFTDVVQDTPVSKEVVMSARLSPHLLSQTSSLI